MNYKKKGISAVVATVLIILITVAAVTIIWAAIIPMINGQLESGTQCLDAVSQVSIVDDYTCFNAGVGLDNNISLQVSRGAKTFALVGVQVLVGEGGSTTAYTLPENAIPLYNTLPDVNEEKVLVFSIPIGSTPDSIQLAPIVTVGNTPNTCDVSSEIVLRAC